MHLTCYESESGKMIPYLIKDKYMHDKFRDLIEQRRTELLCNNKYFTVIDYEYLKYLNIVE